jgi:hypothetical protein
VEWRRTWRAVIIRKDLSFPEFRRDCCYGSCSDASVTGGADGGCGAWHPATAGWIIPLCPLFCWIRTYVLHLNVTLFCSISEYYFCMIFREIPHDVGVASKSFGTRISYPTKMTFAFFLRKQQISIFFTQIISFKSSSKIKLWVHYPNYKKLYSKDNLLANSL